jgi:hypothetical protein
MSSKLVQHIYPVKDVFEHRLNGQPCECMPETDLDEHGNIIIIHNAYDGRDIIEEVENGH